MTFGSALNSVSTRERGFTFVEVMVSSAIGLAIVVMGFSLLMLTRKQFLRAESNTSQAVSAVAFMDALARDIESAGGGTARSWMAIWVENSSRAGATCPARSPLPACVRSDRLTIAIAPVPARDCPIVAATGTTSVQLRNFPSCCLDSAPKHVMLAKGNFWSQRDVTAFDPVACQLTLQPGPMTPHERLTADFAGGSVGTVDVVTYYRDETNGFMRQLVYGNAAQGIADEDRVIADQVLDFQVALGYDFNPTDGFVTESASGNDELLFNAPSEALGSGLLTTALPINLQSVRLSVLFAGAPVDTGSTMRTLDGATVTSTRKIGQFGIKIVPKHLFIF